MRLVICTLLAVCLAACGRGTPASLPIGSAAPDFSLPGIDGRTHMLAEFAASPVLAVVFTCNSCPAAQRAEATLDALVASYRDRGLALVAINPNAANAARFEDLAHTDVGDSLGDMKTRAAFAHLDYPYLSDGESQAVTKQYRVIATPQIFVFDRARHLQYQGRIGEDQADGRTASNDADAAIDALLAGRAVSNAVTQVSGCPPVWREDGPKADAERQAIAAEPVTVRAADAAMLSALRKNDTGKLLLVNFWATWCGPCVTEFPELEATYRMYHARGLEFVAVSSNDPEERPGVIEFLQKQHASHRNLQFGTPDVYGLQAAFDPAMPSSVPFTLLLAPNGDVLYQELGVSDIPKLRRAILANLPDDRASSGQRAYWARN
jgi:thiol-disulfide isomerase/thioredoxin